MKRHLETLALIVIGFLIYFTSSFLDNWNHYFTGFYIILAAIGLYFAYVFLIDSRNYMSFKALFSLTWLGAAGLAALRLTDYQVPWATKTWYLMGICYVVLILGIYLGEVLFPIFARKFDLSKARYFQVDKRIVFGLKKERLFWCVLVATLVSAVSLIINCHIKGYLPFFSSDQNAYLDFYTRWYTFIVAGTTVVGLAYYCIKEIKLSKSQKIVMYLCLFYHILVPILIVSRGTFVTTALSLSVAVFFLNKRKFWVMLLCFVVIFGGYQVGSMTRNLTADYLNTILQPKEIVITGNDQDQGETGNEPLNAEEPAQAEDELSNDEGPAQTEDEPLDDEKQAQAENQPNDSQSQSETETLTFQLPTSVVFFYTYLTVGCDNFNQAVVHSTYMAYGVHQSVPFNVIIRSSYLREKLESSEMFYIRDYLNTGDLFSDAYYDFHIFGIVFLGVLWGVAFGIIESYFLKYQTPCSFMVFGNTLVPVFLGFFQTWMSLFPQWMIWGTAFMVFIFTCFTIQKKKSIEEKEK